MIDCGNLRYDTPAEYTGSYDGAPCIPFLPSVGMMKGWLRLRLRGVSEAQAWEEVMRGAKPRLWSRREISGAHGQSPVMLTVPIIGGSSIVKRLHPGKWRISAHGDWHRIFNGALEAAYGSTPYFEHLYPAMSEVIEAASEGSSFMEFSGNLHKAVTSGIRLQQLVDLLNGYGHDRMDRLRCLAMEKKYPAHADLAFIDVIFRKGTESIFTLLS